MSKKKKITGFIVFFVLIAAVTIGIVLLGKPREHAETLSEVMRDAVLHETMKVSLFGLKDVNPGLISAYCVTAIVGLFAIICRIFVIPRFKEIPGKFQLVLETLVGLFRGLAKDNSPRKNGILSAYIFAAGF